MKLKYTLALTTLAMTTLGAKAVITATKDSSTFTNTYDGNEIYDGTSYVNGWSDSSAPTNESTSGSVLTISNATNTGWVEQNNGSTPWETALTNTSAWTLEAMVDVSDGGLPADNVINLWMSNGSNTLILNISESGIGTFNNNSNLDATANTGTIVVRVAYDNLDGVFSIWRDGALLTSTQTANFNDGSNDRLIVGECCTSVSHTTADIHYVRYDTSGAFAPVPEPSSSALLGLGGLALILRRRK